MDQFTPRRIVDLYVFAIAMSPPVLRLDFVTYLLAIATDSVVVQPDRDSEPSCSG